MTNNYLFETCTGEFNWNKLMRKSVHLVGLYHVNDMKLKKTQWCATLFIRGALRRSATKGSDSYNIIPYISTTLY
jgi:hypothetical protein